MLLYSYKYSGVYILQRNINNNNLYELVFEWLKEYHSTTNTVKKSKLKTLIVTNMLPIVKNIARTIARRSYDPIDDMVQAGSIGLLKAIDSFSFEINRNFKAYAGSLIIGEIRHFIRDKMHAIRVPAHIQELSCRINNFINTLTPEELDKITSENVAEALRIRPRDVDKVVLAERRRTMVSLEEVFTSDSENMGYEELLSKEDYKETSDIEDSKLIIKDILKQLPDEYKEIIELYYYNDMNQAEIAEALNLSKMQVSRKMKKAFSILYKIVSKLYPDLMSTGVQ